MAAIPGSIPVTGKIAPTDSTDTFGTHEDIYGIGGHVSIVTVTDRNAITSDRRKWGMLATVYNDGSPSNNKLYQLTRGFVDTNINNNSNWKEFAAGSSSASGLISETVFVTTTYGASSGNVYANYTFNLSDTKKYFRFEITNTTTTSFFFAAYNLILPISPPDGWCIFANFETFGGSTNSFNGFKFSSGCTYLITWGAAEGTWYFDEFQSKSIGKVQKIRGDIGGTTNMILDQTSITYFYYKSGGDSSVDDNRNYILPPIQLNVGKRFTLVMQNNWNTSFPFRLVGHNDGVNPQETIMGIGTQYNFPTGAKKGSSIELIAIFDNEGFNAKYWAIFAENIRL